MPVATVIAFMEGLGAAEMMLIFVVVLVLFGGDKLPDFARGLGKTMREFKKAAAGVEEEFKRAIEDDDRKQTPKIAAPVPPPVPADSNPDGLPPEALPPEAYATADAPAPSVDSIPPPPLIPLGAPVAAMPDPGPTGPDAAETAPKPAPASAAPTPLPPATGNRARDDYS